MRSISAKPKLAKKTYEPPSFRILDGPLAQAELKVNRDPKDPNSDRLLRLMDEQVDQPDGNAHSSPRSRSKF
jgi:hypothetical protein